MIIPYNNGGKTSVNFTQLCHNFAEYLFVPQVTYY